MNFLAIWHTTQWNRSSGMKFGGSACGRWLIIQLPIIARKIQQILPNCAILLKRLLHAGIFTYCNIFCVFRRVQSKSFKRRISVIFIDSLLI